jgi:hypothetical protein
MVDEANSGVLDSASAGVGDNTTEEAKVKVKEVSPRRLRDYEGMNSESAKRLGFPWHEGHDTVLIDATLSEHRKAQVIEHERFELLLEEKHPEMPYWQAHTAALKAMRRK